MKLAMVWGSYNPPTKGDRILFDALAKHAGHDTDCMLITDTFFSTDHPVGVLEKSEILHGMISAYVKVYMDFPSYPDFFKSIEGKYDEITFLIDTKQDINKVKKALAAWTKTPVVVQAVDCGDPYDEKALLIGALRLHDFELFKDNYGGPEISLIHIWNTLKDRVIWTGSV